MTEAGVIPRPGCPAQVFRDGALTGCAYRDGHASPHSWEPLRPVTAQQAAEGSQEPGAGEADSDG